MSLTVKIAIVIGETPTDDRAHEMAWVEVDSKETVIPPPGDDAAVMLEMVTAVLDRMTTTGLQEAKRQIEQILQVIEAA